jgi:hypothetical protein
MKIFRFAVAMTILLFATSAVAGQRLQFNFAHLEERAEEVVDVTLEGKMLQMASGFLSNKNPEEAKVRQVVNGLRGVYVKSFTFATDGAYSSKDIDAVRGQLRGWERIVTVRSKKSDNVDIYIRPGATGPDGLVVIAAEPREFTVVHIDGPIDLEQLSSLDGQLGIPNLHIEPSRK